MDRIVQERLARSKKNEKKQPLKQGMFVLLVTWWIGKRNLVGLLEE